VLLYITVDLETCGSGNGICVTQLMCHLKIATIK
jgi:hypothetical protein